MHRLGFDDMKRQIHTLILLHLRPGLYTDQWSDAAVRHWSTRPEMRRVTF